MRIARIALGILSLVGCSSNKKAEDTPALGTAAQEIQDGGDRVTSSVKQTGLFDDRFGHTSSCSFEESNSMTKSRRRPSLLRSGESSTVPPSGSRS